MKAFMVQLESPADVLKIQDILAMALKEDKVQDLHGIGCKCGQDGCDKRIDVQKMLDGRINVIIFKGADFIAGITLDWAGAMNLAEKLQGA